jgi:2-polyprenyl-6-methoxyphenol hydroxylase-like FAD-dependent oxidoreductase
MRGLEIGIAGCGIAGLASALLLSRDGHRVTIYERFERPQPLGSGLLIQPTGLAVLDRLGLAHEVVAKGACVRRLYGETLHGERVLDTHYGDLSSQGVFGVGIHRARLFGALFDAVTAAGIPLSAGCDVIGAVDERSGARLSFAGGRRSERHEAIIDCLGGSSPFTAGKRGWLSFGALWTNLECRDGDPFDREQLEQRYDRASRMIGLVPTGANEVALFWSLRADRLDAWRKAGLEPWKREVAALWPACECLLDRIEDSAQLIFARYAHRMSAQPSTGRMVHIGDAWHAASPQLGQGANMALLDAWALAKALREAGDMAEALSRFVALRQGHVRLYQWLTWLFTPLYQSDALLPAVLRDVFLAPLAQFGFGPRIQATMAAGLVGNPLARLGLAMPDYAAFQASTTTRAVP